MWLNILRRQTVGAYKDNPKYNVVTFRLPDHLHDQLVEQVRQQQTNRAELVERVVERWLHATDAGSTTR